MTFTKLKPDHVIFKNKLLNENDAVYETQTIKAKKLYYWIHGFGVIPLHSNPRLEEDLDCRTQLKLQFFGAKEMKERLSAAN